MAQLHTLEEKVAPAHTALLVVDVQNDFCHSDGSLGRRGTNMGLIQQMVPRLKRLIDEARQADATVVFVRMANAADTISEVWQEQRKLTGKDENTCQEGSWGAEFYEVQPLPGERIITKHRYSAFINTDLDQVLRSKGIRTIVVTGVSTNVCVESTARDGFMKDYHVVFPEDCSACGDSQIHQATLRNIGNFFGSVVSSEEVIRVWSQAKVPVSSKR